MLALLAWRIPIVAVGGPLGSALIADGRQTTLMRNNVLGAIVVVAGDLAAVPAVGILGAAGVSVVAAVLVLTLNYRAATDPGRRPASDLSLRAWFSR